MVLKAIDDILNRTMKPINASASIIIGLATFMWGFWISMPWSLFDLSKVYHVMDVLTSWVPGAQGGELLWGIFAMTVGIIIIVGVKKYKYRLILWSARISTIFWGLVAFSYITGDWHSTAWITTSAICIYCAYVALNLAINKDYFDRYWNPPPKHLNDPNVKHPL